MSVHTSLIHKIISEVPWRFIHFFFHLSIHEFLIQWVTLVDDWGKMKVKTVSVQQWNNLIFRAGQVPQLVKVPVYHAQSCKFDALASRKLGMVAHDCIPSTCDLKFWVILSYIASLGSARATWNLFSKCNFIVLCFWFPPYLWASMLIVMFRHDCLSSGMWID